MKILAGYLPPAALGVALVGGLLSNPTSSHAQHDLR
jgi:hypothetical protein